MPNEFNNLENSLREYIIDAQSDSYNSRGVNVYRYNNLKIFMEPKKVVIPHFFVRIGMSESCYNMTNCEHMSGGLGADERYIKRWFEKSAIKDELNAKWKDSQKLKVIKIDELKRDNNS